MKCDILLIAQLHGRNATAVEITREHSLRRIPKWHGFATYADTKAAQPKNQPSLARCAAPTKVRLRKNRTKPIMEQKIISALDQIRPYLQRDGGDVEFVEYTDDKIVKVRLQGHCAGCPMSQMTVKNGIERLLKEAYPEIASVEAVN